MKNPIENLSKLFDSRIKLGIMSMLVVNDRISFNEIKQLLDITDGNLASHLKSLEENDFIQVQKKFVGKKTNTMYNITKKGDKAFKLHLAALEKMIGLMK
ncbi:MAG TPA: transcriptional regulator [Ferruginibacter sp.]|nr:transcriptional regulator [Ferruginibacter sp.]